LIVVSNREYARQPRQPQKGIGVPERDCQKRMPSSSEKPQAATGELMALVYNELRQVAQRYFRMQRPGFTLRPTELVNEACLHLIQHTHVEWQSLEHFRAIATRKIWQVVVDHLRKRQAGKRGGPRRAAPPHADSGDGEPAARGDEHRDGGWHRIPLESIPVEWHDRTVELLDLADALDALAAESSRLHDVVMLHWFGGLKYIEVARALGVSTSTVEKDFRYALAWLSRKLAGAADHAD
jgi:RNA polymerase sigma-70 factor (ECF subfamily)